jgi:hypothetical protein
VRNTISKLFVLSLALSAAFVTFAPAQITGSGTTDYIPLWTGKTSLGNSTIFQSSGKVGVGTKKPAATLDVDGGADVRGQLELFPSGKGPALSLSGTAFQVANNGELTFVSGQSFPGTALLSASNTFNANQTFADSIYVDANVFGVTGQFFDSGGAAVGAGNSSPTQTLQVTNLSTPSDAVFLEAQFNGNETATFYTDALGDTTAIGTKSAAVPLNNGEMVKVFSVEGPEVWFEDYGSAELNGGVASVSLDPTFAQTIDTSSDYHVFLTAKGESNSLYVTNETSTGFDVRESGGGRSSIAFDYHIVAHRKGYEQLRMPAANSPKPVINSNLRR